MTQTIKQAEQHCIDQSLHGPAFGANECQEQSRLAYGIASDGTPDAATGWYRAVERFPASDPRATPRGAFNHWLGGSAGHGHVTISRFTGGADWSTDFPSGRGEGYWNLVKDPRQIAQVWSDLKYVGYSWDIDGVSVRPDHIPARKYPHIQAAASALRLTLTHHHSPARTAHLRTALREVLRALAGK